MASSVDAKLLRATKFPPEFNQKVDMQKVNIQVMKKYVLVYNLLRYQKPPASSVNTSPFFNVYKC